MAQGGGEKYHGGRNTCRLKIISFLSKEKRSPNTGDRFSYKGFLKRKDHSARR